MLKLYREVRIGSDERCTVKCPKGTHVGCETTNTTSSMEAKVKPFDRLRDLYKSGREAGFEYHPLLEAPVEPFDRLNHRSRCARAPRKLWRGGRDSNPRSRFIVPTTA